MKESVILATSVIISQNKTLILKSIKSQFMKEYVILVINVIIMQLTIVVLKDISNKFLAKLYFFLLIIKLY